MEVEVDGAAAAVVDVAVAVAVEVPERIAAAQKHLVKNRDNNERNHRMWRMLLDEPCTEATPELRTTRP